MVLRVENLWICPRFRKSLRYLLTIWILRKQLFQLLRSRTFGQPNLVVQDSYGGGFESFLAAASAVFPRIVNDASHGYICVDA